KNIPEEKQQARSQIWKSLLKLDIHGTGEAIEELVQLLVWNKVHRVEDAIWDPRGKRALFEGLDIKAQDVLLLFAADVYEAMQLLAQYPGGHAVLADYDAFCKTDRFGKFPGQYPFLENDPATGSSKVYYKNDMIIDFVVDDIRNLKYGNEFDVVVCIVLIVHFKVDLKIDDIAINGYLLMIGRYFCII